MQKVNSVNRVLGKHPGRLPDGKACPLRARGLRVGRTRKRTAFPRPVRDHSAEGPFPQAQREASDRRGGGAGAGRGLWPPAGVGSARRCGRGDGPCQCKGTRRDVLRRSMSRPPKQRIPKTPLRAGQVKALRFSRLRGTLSPRPGPPTQRQASAPPWVRVTVIDRGGHRAWSNLWFL